MAVSDSRFSDTAGRLSRALLEQSEPLPCEPESVEAMMLRLVGVDILREALWETYGEQITQMHREAYDDRIQDTNQCEYEFDDDISF